MAATSAACRTAPNEWIGTLSRDSHVERSAGPSDSPVSKLDPDPVSKRSLPIRSRRVAGDGILPVAGHEMSCLGSSRRRHINISGAPPNGPFTSRTPRGLDRLMQDLLEICTANQALECSGAPKLHGHVDASKSTTRFQHRGVGYITAAADCLAGHHRFLRVGVWYHTRGCCSVYVAGSVTRQGRRRTACVLLPSCFRNRACSKSFPPGGGAALASLPRAMFPHQAIASQGGTSWRPQRSVRLDLAKLSSRSLPERAGECATAADHRVACRMLEALPGCADRSSSGLR